MYWRRSTARSHEALVGLDEPLTPFNQLLQAAQLPWGLHVLPGDGPGDLGHVDITF